MKFSAAIKKLSSFTMCCSLVYLSLDSASAAIFTVNSTADTNTGVGNSGTLRFCLNQYGSGDTINFDPTVFPSSTATAITLTSQLPIVRLPVTIAGNIQTNGSPAVAISGAGAFEGFYIVAGPTVSISNINITNALAKGGAGGDCANGGGGGGGVGAGGGIYVDQTATGVTIQNVVLNSNTAHGGSGGNLNAGGSGGSGGGGLNGGAGARSAFRPGGGGGGGDPGGTAGTTAGVGGTAGPQGGGGGVAGAAGGAVGTPGV
ncbi:MAG TPA: hypothetical protein VLG49_01250, partial [Rhabdochlamydiaceae bacterium]|nr:hypothetical protein [Rhabdochlamydiaceae bacterium]